MELSYFAIIIGAIFVNNVVLAQFLGICPFLGVSSKVETSLGMGAAVTFVMAIAAVVAWLIQTYVLVPLDIVYMQTIVFILVIAACRWSRSCSRNSRRRSIRRWASSCP